MNLPFPPRAALLLALAGGPAVPAPAQAPSGAREVPARLLPVPATLSPQMSAVVALPENPAHLEAPRTLEEWKAMARRRESDAPRQMALLRARLGVTVEPATIAGVPCYIITPNTIAPKNRDRLLVGVHGGAYVFGSGVAGTGEEIWVAGSAGIKTIAVDYRLAPEHPFPAAVDDAMAVWKEAVKRAKPATIGLFGSSAGGNLVLCLVQRSIREGVPVPGAIMAGTPWSDLSKTGDSYFANAHVDNRIVTYEGLIEAAAKAYAGGRNLKDPLISPIYGSFAGFPPTFLVTGTRDLLLSGTVRVQRKLEEAGAEEQLEVYEGLSHAQYLLVDSPETTECYAEITRFFDRHLGR